MLTLYYHYTIYCEYIFEFCTYICIYVYIVHIPFIFCNNVHIISYHIIIYIYTYPRSRYLICCLLWLTFSNFLGPVNSAKKVVIADKPEKDCVTLIFLGKPK